VSDSQLGARVNKLSSRVNGSNGTAEQSAAHPPRR
jgi:hypothetical protein